MAVSKALYCGMLIVAMTASSARSSSILVLGMSDGTDYNSVVATTPAPAPVFTGIWNGYPESSALRLGVSNDSNPVASPAPMHLSPIVYTPPVVTPPTGNPAPAWGGPPATPASYDAFINMGTSSFANSDSLTTGSPQAWYLSRAVDRLFGGVPSTSQRLDFENTVLQRTQQTFNQSGVPVSLTLDPNAKAAHTLSVVSQTINPNLNAAIGMTYLGGNGFHYIDNSANAASNINQLEWIVAHNLSHELMLAFNVPEVHDTTGKFIDARNASWSMITSPTATFSPDAVNDLLSRNFQVVNQSVLYSSAQLLGTPTVPEPTTVILWLGIASCGIVASRVRRNAITAKRSALDALRS